MRDFLRRDSYGVGDFLTDGQYEVREVIHIGGMSNVYKVFDSDLKKYWAAKEIKIPEEVSDGVLASLSKQERREYRSRKAEYKALMNEAMIMVGLKSDNVPDIKQIDNKQVGEDGRKSVIIYMDYIEGDSLRNILQDMEGGRLAPENAVEIMLQVCGIMDYFHTKKEDPFVYRDLKPDNIMVDPSGKVVILDFGISLPLGVSGGDDRVERQMGTRGYAAPEQGRSDGVLDVRSDVFSFGRTFYACLTGLWGQMHSLSVDKELEPIRRIVRDSGVSVELDRIIRKAANPDIDKRYNSFKEIEFDLRHMYTKDRKFRVGSWAKVTASFLALLLGLSMLGLGVFFWSRRGVMRESTYQNLLQVGNKASLEVAIDMEPLRIGPYFDYVGLIKEDGLFSEEEESVLLGLLNPNLLDLQKDKDYPDLGYEVGKLYWYYRDGNQGKVDSTKWFYESRNSKPDAQVLYNLGEFYKNLKSATIEARDQGLYKEFFHNLGMAMDFQGGGIVEVSVRKACVECVKDYSYKLRQDGLEQEDVEGLLNRSVEDLMLIDTDHERVLRLREEALGLVDAARSSLEVAFRD